MKENDRWLTEAMDHLDPTLIEDMEGQVKTRRHSAPVRVMLIAACVAALLAVGAVAAEVSGVDIVETIKTALGIQVSDYASKDELEDIGYYISEEDQDKDLSGYRVDLPDGFTWEKASEELLAALEEEPTDRYYKAFDSWDEMEEFSGFDLADNSVLDTAQPSPTCFTLQDPTGETKAIETAFLLDIDIGREPYSLRLHALYTIPSEAGNIHLNISVSGCPDAHANFSSTFFFTVDSLISASQETYLTPDGLETVITRVATTGLDDAGNSTTYQADFALHDMAFHVDVHADNTVSAESLKATLRSILDAYEVP